MLKNKNSKFDDSNKDLLLFYIITGSFKVFQCTQDIKHHHSSTAMDIRITIDKYP